MAINLIYSNQLSHCSGIATWRTACRNRYGWLESDTGGRKVWIGEVAGCVGTRTETWRVHVLWKFIVFNASPDLEISHRSTYGIPVEVDLTNCWEWSWRTAAIVCTVDTIGSDWCRHTSNNQWSRCRCEISWFDSKYFPIRKCWRCENGGNRYEGCGGLGSHKSKSCNK
jgi:hypothetical protein